MPDRATKDEEGRVQHQHSRSGERSGGRSGGRSGDRGRTGLPSGARLEKDSPAIEVLGAIDELDSWIGVVLALAQSPSVREALARIQRDLSDLEAQISSPGAAALSQPHLARIDRSLEMLKAEVERSDEPILPGGSRSSAFAHVCRRTERRLCTFAELRATAGATCEAAAGATQAEDSGLAYLNRLSDLLLVAACLENRATERPEAL